MFQALITMASMQNMMHLVTNKHQTGPDTNVNTVNNGKSLL